MKEGVDHFTFITDAVQVTVTLGKSLASVGAVTISNNVIIDYLINKAAGFIFSTALPSVNILWSNFLLNEKFNFLIQQKEKLNNLFKEVHKIYPTISSSQIIPVILKDATKTKNTALKLQNEGFYVLPINPPTIPVNTSRLRLSLTANMELDEVKNLLEKI